VEAWLLEPAILDLTPDCVPAQIPFVFPDRRLVGRAVTKQETGPGRPGNQALGGTELGKTQRRRLHRPRIVQ